MTLTPTSSPKVQTLPVRVYYEDTDAGGIVFYANYLRFAERGRTEFLRTLGIDHQKLRRDDNLIFAVRHFAIDYLKPARLDDKLVVETSLTTLGGASLEMKQVIRHEHAAEALVVTATAKLVAITPEGKAMRIPDHLRRAFEAWRTVEDQA